MGGYASRWRRLRAEESPDMFSLLCDDELLEVFSYLSNEHLLRIRGVCRRWREVAMYKTTWSRRYLKLHGALGKAILRQAPCVRLLTICNQDMWVEFRSVPSPLPFGYSSLDVRVNAESVVWLEEELRRRQEAAVEAELVLEKLEVTFINVVDDVRPILRTINDCELDFLLLRGGHHDRRHPDEPMPTEQAEASLRSLKLVDIKKWPDRVGQFLLATHASTLTLFSLLGEEAVWASLPMLADCTKLTHLTCHPMAGMADLDCPNLVYLHLVVSEAFEDFVGPASEFVRQATIRFLEVDDSTKTVALTSFVEHLARPPGPRSDLAAMLFNVRDALGNMDQWWSELAASIKGLRSSTDAAISLDLDPEKVNVSFSKRHEHDYDDGWCPVCAPLSCLSTCCINFKLVAWSPPADVEAIAGLAACLDSLCIPVWPLRLRCPAHRLCRAHNRGTKGMRKRLVLFMSNVDRLRRLVCDNPSLHLVGATWVCVRRAGACDWWPQHGPPELRRIPHGKLFNVYAHSQCDRHVGGGFWVKMDDVAPTPDQG